MRPISCFKLSILQAITWFSATKKKKSISFKSLEGELFPGSARTAARSAEFLKPLADHTPSPHGSGCRHSLCVRQLTAASATEPRRTSLGGRPVLYTYRPRAAPTHREYRYHAVRARYVHRETRHGAGSRADQAVYRHSDTGIMFRLGLNVPHPGQMSSWGSGRSCSSYV